MVPLLVVASACHDDPVRTIVDGGSPGEAIAVVSGNGQTGRVGAMFDEPFVVRVTDPAGRGLASAPVEWSVTSGGGTVCHSNPVQCSSKAVTTADLDGRTEVMFRPGLVGQSEVRAQLAGAVRVWVNFTAVTDGVVVHIGPLSGCNPVQFSGPDGSSDTYINGGNVVEWRNSPSSCDSAHIVSTVVPPGGTSVDTGILLPGGRHAFRPDVAGSWEFLDQRSGARGTLTVWNW